jgi:hypothetical protein
VYTLLFQSDKSGVEAPLVVAFTFTCHLSPSE